MSHLVFESCSIEPTEMTELSQVLWVEIRGPNMHVTRITHEWRNVDAMRQAESLI